MTTTKDENKHHSAMPSWSGYNYQGKVALYSALHYMIEKNESDYSCYSLELEWYEDFSIKEGKTYISIHQVKSYKKQTLSDYKDAIWNLLGKSIDGNVAETYLHTSENLTTIKEIRDKLHTLKAPKGGKDKKYTPNYYYKLIMDDGFYDTAFDRFYRYKYHTGNEFCEVNSIDNLIKDKIHEYYKIQSKSETDEQVERVFLRLLNCLNEHITDRHTNEQIYGSKTEPIQINFNCFYDILEKDLEEPSEEYYIRHLKCSFFGVFESTISLLYESNSFKADDLKRVEGVLGELYLLDNDSFLELCKRVTPHVTAPKMNMQNYKQLIPDNGLKQALILILAKVEQEWDENQLFERKKYDESEFYLPTTLDLNPDPLFSKDTLIGEIATDILKNESLDEFLYEVDAMIARHISTHSLEESAAKIDQVPDPDLESDLEIYQRFTKIKKIRIVDLEQAEKEQSK